MVLKVTSVLDVVDVNRELPGLMTETAKTDDMYIRVAIYTRGGLSTIVLLAAFPAISSWCSAKAQLLLHHRWHHYYTALCDGSDC